MKNNKLIRKSGAAVAVLSALLAVQSCSKDEKINFEETGIKASSKTSDSSFGTVSPAPCIVRQLVAGQKTPVGVIEVAELNGDLFLTYKITAPNVFLQEIHADVFKSLDEFQADKKISNGGAVPGKFAYKQSWSGSAKTTQYTVVIPKTYVSKALIDGSCLNIATHASLSNGETAWAGITKQVVGGVSLEDAKQFPGKNWGVYFDFCMDECKGGIDFTYAWEDVPNQWNDADYNDLVIQAEVAKLSTELKLNFIATARGAAYDHKFKIRIPKRGITAVYDPKGAPVKIDNDGTDYIITVFGSTKAALPPQGSYGVVNTVSTEGCSPFASRQIVLNIDNSFSYNPARPFSPFISVYPSLEVDKGESYDLSIFEITGKDTWIDPQGNILPNGIIIPKDWRWPFEWQNIKGAYPDFPKANWYQNLAVPNVTFDKNKCN